MTVGSHLSTQQARRCGGPFLPSSFFAVSICVLASPGLTSLLQDKVDGLGTCRLLSVFLDSAPPCSVRLTSTWPEIRLLAFFCLS